MNDIGPIFRLITPILIVVLGWLVVDKIDTVTDEIGKLSSGQVQNRETIGRIQTDIAGMKSLAQDIARHEKNIDEHDKRLRRVEQSRNSP